MNGPVRRRTCRGFLWIFENGMACYVHGLRPRAGGDPSRPEAVEYGGGILWRGPGHGLGTGQSSHQGGIADEETATSQAIQETVVTTVRSSPTGTDNDSEAGSILEHALVLWPPSRPGARLSESTSAPDVFEA